VALVSLLLVNQYPSPVDDCPYFEDAIAFIFVILGIITSIWYSKRVAAFNADIFTSVTPGAAFDSPAAVTIWVPFAFLTLMTPLYGIPYSSCLHFPQILPLASRLQSPQSFLTTRVTIS